MVLRRLHATSHATMGQLSMGERACITMEPPLAVFRQRGAQAVPAGQYPLCLVGEELVLQSPTKATLGRDILHGMSVWAGLLVKQQEARELFYPVLTAAFADGQTVLMDVLDPERVG